MLEALYEISGVVPLQTTEVEEEKPAAIPAVVPEESEPTQAVETIVDAKRTPATQLPLTIDTSQRDPSEKSAETEEDEGMVLVGRPDTDSS